MTRKVAALTLACIFLAESMYSQLPPCSKVPIPCEQLKQREIEMQVLENLEKQNAHAVQLNNPTFFEDVYAEEFSGVTSYGVPVNKRALIQSIQSPQQKFQTVIASNIQVKIFLDSASVLSLRSERGANNGKEFSRQLRILRVYIYSARGWKVVSQLEMQLPSTLAK